MEDTLKNIDLISSFFPDLSGHQMDQFKALGPLFLDWNQKINLISRKDTENFYPHHVLHALSIAKVFRFNPGTSILDLGTGGGFPGIPLAIFYPDIHFHLVDGKAKKIKVVQDLIAQLHLKNARATAVRAEEHQEKYDFVTCRAVASLEKLYHWTLPRIKINTKMEFLMA